MSLVSWYSLRNGLSDDLPFYRETHRAPNARGQVYLAAVLHVYGRGGGGWSIADHLRTELVVDALEMARWRRRPARSQTVVHSDRGAQYTSWAFGHRRHGAAACRCFANLRAAPRLCFTTPCRAL